jgi:hypothetical protein
VAISVARYANATGRLGVPPAFAEICLSAVSDTFRLRGIATAAAVFCGLGPKIRVSYQCAGRDTVLEMMQSPSFSDVLGSCRGPLSLDIACKTCLNYGIVYLRRLIGSDDNVALSVCRSAVFVALATQQGVLSYDDILTCFFGVQGITTFPGISVLAPLQLLCYNDVQLVDDFVSNARVYVYQDQFLSRRLQLLCQMPLSMILKLQRIKVFRYRRDISSSSSSLTGFQCFQG